MAQRPTVRWNEKAGRWMAWVRFPDGTRRKVERIEKADAQRDLDELLALRAQSLEPGPRHTRKITFNEVIDAWFADGCPNVASKKSRHARAKSPNTVANARQLLGTSIRPVIGHLWVDRTSTQRLEELFADMAERGYATSTIDRNWNYLDQALQHGQRRRTIKTNPAADVLLPEKRAGKNRKSLSIEQMQHLVVEAIPADPRPAMWLTGLCGMPEGRSVAPLLTAAFDRRTASDMDRMRHRHRDGSSDRPAGRRAYGPMPPAHSGSGWRECPVVVPLLGRFKRVHEPGSPHNRPIRFWRCAETRLQEDGACPAARRS